MRLAAYAGASIALTGAAILRAFHERPNFYSASVYLAQSNACRMILLNFLLFCVGSFMLGLQRLLYGSLRPIEIEQLWDKAWYAITETALAMTTFREEIGVWFIVMFATLLAGKVWSWIAEGRVEVLDQQPPNNPRMFHTRLLASLVLSESFAFYMLRYCVRTLIDEPKPGMMVMFAFEFAVLSITSSSTTIRYGLSLYEMFIIRQQTIARVEERKQEIRAARAAAQDQMDPGASNDEPIAPQELSLEDEIDEGEIDVPGWQDKGRFVFYLELFTDFLKLVVYLGFFTILFAFNGIPLHIVRDVYFTMRSFIKRILDFVKYRNATRDMNARYPDATVEELERDGTCIICREDMRPWQDPANAANGAGGGRAQLPTDERQRPKKLPCGHILHFGCLRSWLERQQVCPTCRRSVLAPPIDRTRRTDPGQAPRGGNHGENGVQNGQPQAQQPHNINHRPGRNQVRARTFGFGPIRITFAAGNGQQVRHALQQARNRPHGDVEPHRGNGIWATALRMLGIGGNPPQDPAGWSEQLREVEQQIHEEIASLNLVQTQLSTVRALQAELSRLRMLQSNPAVLMQSSSGLPASTASATNSGLVIQNPAPNPAIQPSPGPSWQPRVRFNGQPLHFNHQTLTANSQGPSMVSGDPQLPPGLTLPDGWTLMPLQRWGPQQNPAASSPHNESPQGLRPAQQSPNEPVSSGLSDSMGRDMRSAGPSAAHHGNSTATANMSGSSSTHATSNTSDVSTPSRPPTHASTPPIESGDGPVSVSPIPDWSSPNVLESTSNDEGSSHGRSLPNDTPATNGHVEANNGKSRAATVEDAAD